MSKRVLFAGVSSMRDHAGQHKLYFIADFFGRHQVPVTVLVPDLEENRSFLAARPHVEARYYPPGSAIGDAWQKAKIVREGDWSCIWVVGTGVRSFVARLGTSRSTPIIKDFDEFPSMIENIGAFRRFYLQWIERRMVAQAQAFTVASSFLERSVHQMRPDIGAQILRLPVAISAEEHRIHPELVRQLREASVGRPILLYVGSIIRFYEDQLDEVIGLARVLRRRGSRAVVRIAGSGPDLDYFKEKAKVADVGDTLEFTGHVRRERDLASHMEASHVLLFPFAANLFNLSRCPTKAFHYAAANKPVVTNMTGEVADLFGKSALYYPEHDVEAFADRCEHAIGLGCKFDNGIPFDTLTWEARGRQFLQWLDAHRLLPKAAVAPKAY